MRENRCEKHEMCAYFSVSTPQPTTPSSHQYRSGAIWCKGNGQYAQLDDKMPMQGTGRPDETRAHNLFVHPALMAECADTPAASPPSFQSPPFQTAHEITATAPCPKYFVPFCYSFFKGCNKVNSQSETGEDGGADTALLTKKNPDLPLIPPAKIDLFDCKPR